MYAMTHSLNVKNDLNKTNIMSPKWSYNFLNQSIDRGSSLAGNINVLLRHGSATWAEFAYSGDKTDSLSYLEWSTDLNVWKNALHRQADKFGHVTIFNNGEFTTVTSPSSERLKEIKELLTDGYVLVTGVSNNSWVYKPIVDNPNSTFDDSLVGQEVATHATSGFAVHAMTIVGYNDHVWADHNNNGIVEESELGAFKLANSWGETWGQSGFCWISYDSINVKTAVPGMSTHLRGFTISNAFWITAKKNYTPRLVAEVTMNHAKRGQIAASIGISSVNDYKPGLFKNLPAFNGTAGDYAFNGTQVAHDATFVLDLSDLAYRDGQNRKWYFSIEDKVADTDVALAKKFTLTNYQTNEVLNTTSTLPATVDGDTLNLPIFYKDSKDPAIESVWSLHSSLLVERLQLESVVINGKIYVTAGSIGSNQFTDLEVYDPQTDRWSLLAKPTTITCEMQVAVLNNKIYAIGKINRDDAFIQVESYDTQVAVWTHETTLPLDINTGYDLASANGKLYIVGGGKMAYHQDPVRSNSLTEYDPVTKSMIIKAPLITHRFDVRALTFKDEIWIFGGYDPVYDLSTQVEIYNPATDSWRIKGSISFLSEQIVPVADNNNIYILDKYLDGYVIEEFGIVKLNQTNMELESLVEIKNQRDFAAMVPLNNRLFVMGGGKERYSPKITVESFALPTTGITEWASGVSYKLDDMVSYNGKIWKCLYAHISLEVWYPGAPGLWIWEEIL
jgi:hypothetical protein